MNTSRGAFGLTAIIMLIFGIIFFAFPDFAAKMFSTFVGIAFLLAAISAFLTWVTLRRSMMGGSVPIISILCLVMALVCLLHPLGFAEAIGWVIALCVTIGGIGQLADALRSPVNGIDMTLTVVASVIVIAFGVASLIQPTMLIVFLGATLLVEGVYLLIACWRAPVVDSNL